MFLPIVCQWVQEAVMLSVRAGSVQQLSWPRAEAEGWHGRQLRPHTALLIPEHISAYGAAGMQTVLKGWFGKDWLLAGHGAHMWSTSQYPETPRAAGIGTAVSAATSSRVSLDLLASRCNCSYP